MNKIDKDEADYWKRASNKGLVQELGTVETIEGTISIGDEFRGGEVLSILDHPESSMLFCVIQTPNGFFEHDLERLDKGTGNDGMTDLYIDPK